MRSVLITGASGFVGQSLCKKMASNGWQVCGTVRSAKQAASLPIGVQAVQIESIAVDTDWSNALAGVDTVVHLAARVHVMNDTVSEPLSAFRQINVAGTERLARMAATKGVKRFVYISSVKVNGEGREKPFTEYDIPAPEDPYGVSKWEAEQVLHRIAVETGIEITIIRPPLIYGPHVGSNFLRLLDLVNRNVPLPLSRVHNRRSLIYKKVGQNTLPFRAGMNAPVPKARIMLKYPAWELKLRNMRYMISSITLSGFQSIVKTF